MTIQSITSKQQKQFNRFVEDASNRALEEINPDKDGLQRLFERGGKFQSYLVAGINRFTAKVSDYDLARTILGKDFISPEEVAKSRKGVVYTDDQLAQFGDTVPSQEVLEWCRDNGYMVVAGPNRPMSLLEIRDLQSKYFHWYAGQVLAQNDKADTRWLMLRKEPVPESTSKNWGEQQALLSDNETTPNATEVVWCITTYKVVRDVYLLPSIYVRTSSFVSGGRRVRVGRFGAKGLDVDDWWRDDARRGVLGLSSARKK